jgi:HEPN domain-containing protein
MAVTRTELQRLARDRARDAKVLLTGRRWSAAYYMAGYAVECALKSCVIKFLQKSDKFPERKFSEQCWTHNLDLLLRLSGLESELGEAFESDPELSVHWVAVRDWNESSRYKRVSKAKSLRLFKAITDAKHGVLPWLARRW